MTKSQTPESCGLPPLPSVVVAAPTPAHATAPWMPPNLSLHASTAFLMVSSLVASMK